MKKVIQILAILILVVLLSGCETMGTFRANNITNMVLSQPNFNIVARDIQGTAMHGYLFGFIAPQGLELNTFALIKVSGDEKSYAAALKNLWNNYREKYGDMEGKKLALVNIHQDTETLNTFVYTEARYFITADVIEFV